MTDQYTQLAQQIKSWGIEAGFQQVGITDVDLAAYKPYYDKWLKANYHGEMEYMQRHAEKRSNPSLLHEGSLRCISFRLDYRSDEQMQEILASPNKAYISRYALGRDYHKLMRKRMAQLAERIQQEAGQQLSQRAFVDSAPVLERALAEKSALGWIGKNTMLINSKAGSYFFLGEILTDLPLPIDAEQDDQHCGSCSACLPACPTNAFVSAYQLDARKCISYLTIELKYAIPEELRPLIGNRIFGCDDCQIVCPWNKFSQISQESDFSPRHHLEDVELLELFAWSEEEFLEKTAGSAIRRIGYQCWLRNLAVALGNAPANKNIVQALQQRFEQVEIDSMVKEHISWALERQRAKS